MAPIRNVNIAKQKPTKCSTANVLKLLLVFTSVLFAVSIIVTFNLTTSVKAVDTTSNARVIEDPRKLRNGKKNRTVEGTAKSKSEAFTSNQPLPSDLKLLQWLKEQGKDSTSSSLQDALSTPLHYPPGSLPLTQLSTFQHCYTDPTIYGNHLHNGGSKRRGPYSEKHKLALVLVPKSGSSTGRFMMKVSEVEFAGYSVHIISPAHLLLQLVA